MGMQLRGTQADGISSAKGDAGSGGKTARILPACTLAALRRALAASSAFTLTPACYAYSRLTAAHTARHLLRTTRCTHASLLHACTLPPAAPLGGSCRRV